MFKEIFDFSFPGFETPEELQLLKEYEYYLKQKKIKEEFENGKDDEKEN